MTRYAKMPAVTIRRTTMKDLWCRVETHKGATCLYWYTESRGRVSNVVRELLNASLWVAYAVEESEDWRYVKGS